MKKPVFLDARYSTPILAAIGAALIVFYISCATSCAYLKGSILGVDLKYLGLIYLGAVVLLCLARRGLLLLLLLSFGIGSEVFLVGYQVHSGVYCPYCLGFGTVIVLMFAVNFDKEKIRLMIASSLAGLAVFIFLFSGSLTPAYAEERGGMTSFGNGEVNVRLYSDYFCSFCNSLEGDLDGIIVDLVRRKIIRITFIDTPMHKDTPLYARYFLYILNENNDLKQALKARKILIEAAVKGIITPGELESFLAQKGVRYKPFDVKPVFDIFNRYMAEDRITSTPTCVIATGGTVQVFKGAPSILEALKGYQNKK